MEKIKLSDILTAILEFKKNPTEENDAKVHEYMQKLQVIPYLGIDRKAICASIICQNIFNVERDMVKSAIHLVVAETMYGILEYCINLENDLESFVADETIYDVLCEFGFIDYIMKFCGTDFNRLCDLIDKMINFGNIYKIVEAADNFSSDKIDALVNELDKATKTLTPEMLSDMKSILNGQDPHWEALKESIGDEALGNALDKDIYSTLGISVPKKREEAQTSGEKPEKESKQKQKA